VRRTVGVIEPPAQYCALLHQILELKSALEDVLSHHTGQPIEKIQTDTDRDFVMTAEQAKDYGIIDEILSPRTAVDQTGAIRAASA